VWEWREGVDDLVRVRGDVSSRGGSGGGGSLSEWCGV